MGHRNDAARPCPQALVFDTCRYRHLSPGNSSSVRTIELVDLHRAASRWVPVIAALVGLAYVAGIGTAVHAFRVSASQQVRHDRRTVEADTIKRRAADAFIEIQVCTLQRDQWRASGAKPETLQAAMKDCINRHGGVRS
jgi:hypothetical protein